MYSKILGTGSYLPSQVRSNADLEKMVDTSDDWIVTRTGIRERRIAAENETVADMGAIAAQHAIEMAGIQTDDIDLIIVATTSVATPSHRLRVRCKLSWVFQVAQRLTLQQLALVLFTLCLLLISILKRVCVKMFWL